MLCKPEAWTPDSQAEAREYTSCQNHTIYWDVLFANGRKEQIYSGTIVATIPYPKESDYLNIATDADEENVLSTLSHLKELEAKYPVTKKYLDPSLANLQQQSDQYAKGNRKVNGAWLTKMQMEKLAEDNRRAADALEKESGNKSDPSSTLTITAQDGTVYHNVTVTKAEPDGLTVTHSNGICKIDFENLPVSLREKYHYDTATAAAFRKTKQHGKAP